MENNTSSNERTDNQHDCRSHEVPKSSSVAKHTLGVILLFCTVLMWASCNFLDSSIFADGTYPKPFFANYVTSTFFILLIIPRFVSQTAREYKNGTLREATRSLFSRRTIRTMFGRDSGAEKTAEAERETLIRYDLDDGRSSTMCEVLPSVSDDPYAGCLSMVATAQYSLAICVLWLVANYFNVAGLQWTTVASTTILTATSSIWALIIGVILRVERFTWLKSLGVLICFSGIIIISCVDVGNGVTEEPLDQDEDGIHNSTTAVTARVASTVTRMILNAVPDKTPGEIALGDALGFMGAVLIGVYTVMVKRSFLKALPKDLHVGTFLGLIGVFNLFLLLPLFPILHYTGIEPFRWPQNGRVTATIILRALSSFGADIFWAFANMFTSPLIAALGLSLNIPLGLIGQMVIQGRYENWIYWVGAFVVVAGFVIVERQSAKEEGVEEEFLSRSQLPNDSGESAMAGSNTVYNQGSNKGKGKAKVIDNAEIGVQSRGNGQGYGTV